jgi:ankyrin repeat protein
MRPNLIGTICIVSLLSVVSLSGPVQRQKSVCEVFEDLKAEDGRKLTVKGELFIEGNVAVLAASECESEFVAAMFRWPTVINLRPSGTLPVSEQRELRDAVTRIEGIRKNGKAISATATITGNLRVLTENKGRVPYESKVENTFGPMGKFPAEMVYDDIESIVIDELPAAAELPVVPICDLFKNLEAWKGKRIAIRASQSGTSEGSWLNGDCKDRFVTDGFKWPASLSLGSPAYYAGEEFNALFREDSSADEKVYVKMEELVRGRNSVDTIATYVGTLHVRDQYFTECREDGTVQGYGYGHLSAAPAEFLIEAVRDPEVVPLKPRVKSTVEKCKPKDFEKLCREIQELDDAASAGCVDRVREIIGRRGIDSKGPGPSNALEQALRNSHKEVVEVLVNAGAPVNPVTQSQYETPLFGAGQSDNIEILRFLIRKGLKVDQKDKDGETYLSSFGFFEADVAHELIKAGANPNARDRRGATALMHASAYGYEDVVRVLIENGADVNLTDYNGRTALMYAVGEENRQYFVDAIPLLLAKGADASRRDKDGKTALDIATSLKHKYAIELLQGSRK